MYLIACKTALRYNGSICGHRETVQVPLEHLSTFRVPRFGGGAMINLIGGYVVARMVGTYLTWMTMVASIKEEGAVTVVYDEIEVVG